MSPPDPHRGQPVLHQGAPLAGARAVAVLVHGRGSTAQNILGLVAEMPVPGVAFLAPQAAGGSWYPQSFLAPLASNQPYLDSALSHLSATLDRAEAAGIPAERLAVLGFSQGACLTIEHTLRNPRRYGAIVGLTGGFIGPPGSERGPVGSLDGTPVFLGSSDPDPHVPVERFRETVELFRAMGAAVTDRLYPGMPHTVNRDETAEARRLLEALTR